ncbi:MAG: HEAT repeat domain-containing protein [Planctomycetota bacterium]|jgi:HEAT repeat protein
MRAFVLCALLLAAVLPAGAGEKEEARREREKEEARIRQRVALKKDFNAAEKIVAEKFEAFALQPIRTWDSALAAVLAEPKEALGNPVRYYLLDDDWEVKAFACFVVGRAGLLDRLPEVMQAYDDARYPIIRRKAVEAAATFARAKHQEALPLLEKGLADEEPGVRLLAVEGMEWLAHLAHLRTATQDKDPDTRYRAAGALARLDDEKAQADLREGFRSYVANRDLRRRASLEVYDVGERYAQFLNAIALGYWGGPAGVKLLSTALLRQGAYKNKLFLSIGAAASLGQSRPTAKAALAEQERAIRAAMGDGEGTVRAMGAFAAGYTRDSRYIRGLQRLLKDAQTDVRHNAVEALGHIPAPSAIAILASALKSERDVGVRLAAVRALSRHPERDAVGALAVALRDKRYMVRAAAARMLGRRGHASADAVKPLLRAARDRDYGVREAAVVALSRIGAPECLPGIVGALKDRDRGVRIRALRALARFPHRALARAEKAAAARCVDLLVSASEIQQRRAAHECLVAVRSPHGVPPLLRELEHDSVSRRMAAFPVLRDYHGGRTLDYSPPLQGTKRRESVKQWKEWWEEGGPIVAPPPPPRKRANQDLPLFHRYTRDLRWRGIDLVLCYDSTGSMIPVIRAVKQRVDLLIEESSRIVPNLRLSLFTYRDEGEEYVYYGTPLTYATDNLKAFVQVAEANRGGDLPEAVTKTVRAAVERLDWRKDAQKVIVVIGDAPYHPENAPALFSLVRKFSDKANRGTVHAIYTDPNRLGESIQARPRRATSRVTYPFLDRLGEMAKVGGGKAITIEDTEMLITEILILSFGERWRAELESRLDFE